jgi:hypothetical protein
MSPAKPKDKKLQAFINFYLSLEDEDFWESSIRNTLLALSKTGQVKIHPPKKEKLEPLYFESIVEKF